jgi:diacylglycerol kinase family enzyme
VTGTAPHSRQEASCDRWFAIVDPSPAAAGEWFSVARLLREAGLEVTAVFTTHRYHAVELTVGAVGNGFRRILAVGDDRLLHEVVNGAFIQRTVPPAEITLGIIPAGTCGIAGIPKAYPEAVAAIASGYASLYSVATVAYSQSHYDQQRMMVAGARLGLSATLTARMCRLREEGKTTAARRFRTFATTLLTYRAPQVRVYADDALVYRGYLTGATVGIDSREGRLTIALLPGKGARIPLHLACGMLRGTSPRASDVLHRSGRSIRIETSGTFAVAADGVPLGESPVEFRIVPDAVKVAFPAPANDNPSQTNTPRRDTHPAPHPADTNAPQPIG